MNAGPNVLRAIPPLPLAIDASRINHKGCLYNASADVWIDYVANKKVRNLLEERLKDTTARKEYDKFYKQVKIFVVGNKSLDTDVADANAHAAAVMVNLVANRAVECKQRGLKRWRYGALVFTKVALVVLSVVVLALATQGSPELLAIKNGFEFLIMLVVGSLLFSTFHGIVPGRISTDMSLAFVVAAVVMLISAVTGIVDLLRTLDIL
ncbi:MAG: hypothetical protein CML51_05895 [Rhodobacteraceae bacterium]|nr:hypothetical protein [Paracoccaceae bacterium]|tara:strand:- start:1252 stop:1878 length:627 start_codon:yes stop_codon:yes gene_type:complete